jgi:hypothetical protein
LCVPEKGSGGRCTKYGEDKKEIESKIKKGADAY